MRPHLRRAMIARHNRQSRRYVRRIDQALRRIASHAISVTLAGKVIGLIDFTILPSRLHVEDVAAPLPVNPEPFTGIPPAACYMRLN